MFFQSKHTSIGPVPRRIKTSTHGTLKLHHEIWRLDTPPTTSSPLDDVPPPPGGDLSMPTHSDYNPEPVEMEIISYSTPVTGESEMPWITFKPDDHGARDKELWPEYIEQQVTLVENHMERFLQQAFKPIQKLKYDYSEESISPEQLCDIVTVNSIGVKFRDGIYLAISVCCQEFFSMDCEITYNEKGHFREFEVIGG
ncbi:hypothetical protein Rhal01_03476 [Rubritalea halochordaticola]|uniref:DUF2262 domain-containing protein n=1 Tax=Rubritalea halochordaticola TaxID=714537 RepID=A0ABP9V3N8_9BACT